MHTLKKLVLSLSVVVLFALYSYREKKELGEIVKAPTPTQTQQSLTIAPTLSPTGAPNQTSNTQPTALPPTTAPSPAGKYKDGEYTGKAADAYYGNIQVKTTVRNGLIADVQFLQYPNDREHSIEINTMAMPILKSEAIQAQSEKVDTVSGATDTSQAFIESLGDALKQAAI